MDYLGTEDSTLVSENLITTQHWKLNPSHIQLQTDRTEVSLVINDLSHLCIMAKN